LTDKNYVVCMEIKSCQ